jgi:hypothetical protein
MVAEHKIDRQKLISGHNPVLTEIATDSPLTVGNGELAFTADITGMQTIRGISGTPVVYNVTMGMAHETGKQGKVQLYTG